MEVKMKIEDFESLKKQIKTTYFARYASSRRLSHLNKLSLVALTTASLSLIVTTLTAKYLDCLLVNNDLVDLLQVLGAIVILILSVVVTFAELSLKSERMRNSADKINGIYKRLVIITFEKNNFVKIENLYKKYHETVIGENHTSWDYKVGRIERKIQESENVCNNEELSIVNKLKNNISEASFLLIILLSICFSLYLILLCQC